MKRDNGGPAFPCPRNANETNGNDCEFYGMSLRDYFIAHAPISPTWDFEVKMTTPRPEPFLGEKDWPANKDEIVAWDCELAIQRMKQWPVVWADAMLEARKQ